jgi:glycosyltransferase involved in cell wall biosynthesis
MHVLIAGSHPTQYNGYAKVVYHLAEQLCRLPDVQVSVFGFQANAASRARADRSLPPCVFVYDAALRATRAEDHGFGFSEMARVVATLAPDVLLLYNDLLVINKALSALAPLRPFRFRLALYVDQVYPRYDPALLTEPTMQAHLAIAFTEYWAGVLRERGFRGPVGVLPHGFDDLSYSPVPRDQARAEAGVDPADFVVLNMNRNSPRKRWDVTAAAFALLLARVPRARLLVGTRPREGWDLVRLLGEAFEAAGLDRSASLDRVSFLTPRPQELSDRMVNVAYCMADVGLNTCDGEGFGLCNFEQAALGVPQVVPRLGGFTSFFDDSNCLLVDPRVALQADLREPAAGEMRIADPRDFADALARYEADPDLRALHGTRCREAIVASGRFAWPGLARRLADMLRDPHQTA